MSLKWIYIKDFPIGQVEVDPSNERRKYNPLGIVNLANSIGRIGQLTPTGIELQTEELLSLEKILATHPNAVTIYGNERTHAIKLLASEGKLDTIKAKVFARLTPEERSRMQVTENATKELIPRPETAESLWDYYKILLEKRSKGEFTKEDLDQSIDHWSLPIETRKLFSASLLLHFSWPSLCFLVF